MRKKHLTLSALIVFSIFFTLQTASANGRLCNTEAGATMMQTAWWQQPGVSIYLDISQEQINHLEEAYKQFRIQQIELKASYEKENFILKNILGSESYSETDAKRQLKKTADAKSDLHQAELQHLVAVRSILSLSQYNKIAQKGGCNSNKPCSQKNRQGSPSPQNQKR